MYFDANISVNTHTHTHTHIHIDTEVHLLGPNQNHPFQVRYERSRNRVQAEKNKAPKKSSGQAL